MIVQNTVLNIYRCLDELAPFSTQLSWDNSGLLVGDFSQPVRVCVLALDVTEKAVRFAKEHDAQLIITHHPVIFSAIRNVTADSLVWKLVRGNISVISAHTNLDLAEGGVNDALAAALCLQNVRPFENEDGLGRIGELPDRMEPAAFGGYIREKLGPRSSVAFTERTPVRTVALVGGAGGDYLQTASLCGADAYLTGELRHHEWMAAQSLPISVCTAGHYATEAVVLPALLSRFEQRFPETAFLLCESTEVSYFGRERSS